MKNTTFIHKSTGVIFPNRHAARIVMGTERYNRFLSNNEFEWQYEEK